MGFVWVLMSAFLYGSQLVASCPFPFLSYDNAATFTNIQAYWSWKYKYKRRTNTQKYAQFQKR